MLVRMFESEVIADCPLRRRLRFWGLAIASFELAFPGHGVKALSFSASEAMLNI
jgi:hypothetical protein